MTAYDVTLELDCRELLCPMPVIELARHLADVPVDAKGKAPKLRKQRFLVFADPVRGRPGSLQLVDPAAQVKATAVQSRVGSGAGRPSGREAGVSQTPHAMETEQAVRRSRPELAFSA